MTQPLVATRSLSTLLAAVGMTTATASADWSHYGGDEGGTRYSAAAQITPKNVDNLIPAWTLRAGYLRERSSRSIEYAKLQDTPILVGDHLILCTPFNQVIAVDPGTGKEAWRF